MKGKISGKKWFERFPHPVVMLFGILVLTMVMSYLLPAGQYDRVLVEGRERVVPGSYHIISSTPLSFMDLFRAIPQGFRTASDIIFIVLASGIMFGILEKSRMIENAVGTVVKHLGQGRRYFLIVIMTYLYGFLGVV